MSIITSQNQDNFVNYLHSRRVIAVPPYDGGDISENSLSHIISDRTGQALERL